jgi:hypothetical protein
MQYQATTVRRIKIVSTGVEMNTKFDIFKRLPDGHPLWVRAVEGLEEAIAQVARLAGSSPDEYFIYNPYNGTVIPARMASGSQS